MRCLTLADALRQSGVQIRFVSRGLPAYLSDMLTVRGLEFAPLGSATAEEPLDDLAHSNWLGTSQSQDARDTAEALADRKWDWLVVDHYALDVRWESAMRSTAGQIMAIDDLADRKHDCDVLLDQNYYRDMQTRYDGKVPDHCRLLLGPRYALLREEFRKLHGQVRPRTGEVKRILVFFGGVDADNYTGLAIRALSGLDIKDIDVNVVIGAQHPCRSEIEQVCVIQGYACYVQTTRMAELMAEADLAIGAGGSASWERCCLGLPALLTAFADNQINISIDLASIGACTFVGAKGAVNEQSLQSAIICALKNPDRQWEISKTAYLLADGLGVDRVLEYL
jgi:UDP-2,4-diacetamido-2,4,6-trideoxy-beta-L-altropyranose hydrolase